MFTAALVGNPNVGKTTLFNALTGSNQYVGNWAGVTVEKKEGFLNKDFKIVDLPGIYAMDTFSNEEKVSKEFLLKGNVDVIINIVDASNLSRNLYLTTQLKQFKIPIILVINMIDVAKARGLEIDFEKLSKELGLIILPISASKNDGLTELKNILFNKSYKTNTESRNSKGFQFESEKDAYSYIDDILNNCVKTKNSNNNNITEKIDKILLNRFLSYPIFLLIFFLIFKFTFSWVGQPLSDTLRSCLENTIIPNLDFLLGNSSLWFKSLLLSGIVKGVGSVVVFLPVILALFIGISFLEDSGYMARAAFIMDKLMRTMGLSGKAFIPLIVGFGCSVPGIMSARTLESEKDRKLTALLVPLMSCNARLPVYALIASIFFPGKESLVAFSLYGLGILIAFLIGLLFKNTLFKKDEEPFLIELPEYKMPDIKNLLLHTWDKGKGFLKKAGTIIFSVSVLIWFLSNFNLNGLTSMNESFLAGIGKLLAPVFKPLGFGNWQTSVSILSGLMAKEVIISSMGIIFGNNLNGILPTYFSSLSALSFLVFVLLYTPCISTVVVMRKEYGKKMAVFSVVYQVLLAWIVSFLVYNIGKLFL
ncbi:ferrous iron transport protein B [Haloimpatiens sp. FM7315]|uniref:ferrous iron transport protein B n=1 Tax=Haloimpatiens sp. FM7315 TaxID=3298609 RepID=UPI00370B79C4